MAWGSEPSKPAPAEPAPQRELWAAPLSAKPGFALPDLDGSPLTLCERTLTDRKVTDARKALFGSWETNWRAYNVAHDLDLPGVKGPRLEFPMYPQAETAAGRFDWLDPDTFKYTLTAREVSA